MKLPLYNLAVIRKRIHLDAIRPVGGLCREAGGGKGEGEEEEEGEEIKMNVLR